MILVFDIGNSSIKGAFFEDATCLERFAMDASSIDSPERIESELKRLAGRYDVEAAACVSVVPYNTAILQTAIGETFGLPLNELTTDSPSPLQSAYSTPETLGADRLALAVAAFSRHGTNDSGVHRPVIALDAGTAITTEVISPDGTYLGGTISPGPDLLQQSLKTGTAQLPGVDLVVPERSIGSSTDESIRSGIMFGLLDSVQGILLRHAAHFSDTPFVVATGGWADWFKVRIPQIDIVEQSLVLFGVQQMYAYGKAHSAD